MQVLRLVPISTARAFVPDELKIVPILPGRTLAGIHLADYRPGSILTYKELLVVPAIVRRGRKVGFWISHIYVDDETSVAGGREIWGLPKEMVDFKWEDGRIQVEQAGQALCDFSYELPRSLGRLPVVMPNLSQLNGQLLYSKANIRGELGLGRGDLHIPATAPYGGLGLNGSGRVFHFHNLEFIASSPTPI